MTSKRANAPKEPNHRQARAARSANAHRDAKPDNANDSLEVLVAKWRELHIVGKRTEAQIEKVKGEVKAGMIALGVNHLSTPSGTPTLIERSGATKVDWESIARANIDKEVLEVEVRRHTKVGDPTVVLEADRSWTLAAKSG